MKYNWLILVGILIVAVLAGIVVWPSPLKIGEKEIKIHQGLDLKGGIHLVYQLDQRGSSLKSSEAQAGTIDVLERRVNSLGVSEPVIQPTKVGDLPGVIIELPGITDVEKAKTLIGKVAQLQFLEIDPSTPLGVESTQGENLNFKPTGLNGSHLKKTYVDVRGGTRATGFTAGGAVIALEFNQEGTNLFKEITSRNLGKPVAIELDEEIISAPTVQSVIEEGKGQIEGLNFEEAKDLSRLLNAGALPVPIKLQSESVIGPILGKESIQKSLLAGLIGSLLIIAFMIGYYGRIGILAVVALFVYLLVTLAIFELIPVTLTLAGIAGFIFSVGAAVDANILVFERIKEERMAGKEGFLAIEEGFKRSWSSIWPSNFSSLLTSAILYWGTTGIVRGFALTLAIGILVSMLTALTFTRALIRAFGPRLGIVK